MDVALDKSQKRILSCLRQSICSRGTSENTIVDSQPKHNKPGWRPARTPNLQKAKKGWGWQSQGRGSSYCLMCLRTSHSAKGTSSLIGVKDRLVGAVYNLLGPISACPNIHQSHFGPRATAIEAVRKTFMPCRNGGQRSLVSDSIFCSFISGISVYLAKQ